MKKLCAGICALLMLAAAATAGLGEITHPYGVGQNGYEAVVISKNVTVRATQNTNAKSVKRLNYGERFAAMPVGNGWCEVYLTETEGLDGYVLEDYVLLNPAYITTEESTPVYAWQARNAKRVGLLGRGETYPIIRMEGNWMLISLRGAAGWILRPSGDPTGTARMKTADVLKIAEQYFLRINPWGDYQQMNQEQLKEFYVFAEFDAMTREWKVTYDSKRDQIYEIRVDDATGEVGDFEPVNG